MASKEELEEAQKQWIEYSLRLPQGGEQNATLRIVHRDPLPAVDERGWRRAEGWRIVWEGTILKEWGNWGTSLHGGVAAWLIDNCTTAALVGLHTPIFWGPPMTAGVSINMEISHLHPAPVGARIRITAEVLRLSETLANLRGEIADAETSKVFVTGNHIKAWKPKRPRAKL